MYSPDPSSLSRANWTNPGTPPRYDFLSLHARSKSASRPADTLKRFIAMNTESLLRSHKHQYARPRRLTTAERCLDNSSEMITHKSALVGPVADRFRHKGGKESVDLLGRMQLDHLCSVGDFSEVTRYVSNLLPPVSDRPKKQCVAA